MLALHPSPRADAEHAGLEGAALDDGIVASLPPDWQAPALSTEELPTSRSEACEEEVV